jgi:probable F420-dependent oxidoreductase
MTASEARVPIELSMRLSSFTPEALPTWRPMLEAAQLMDRSGIDRLVVSDHVVFGEHLEEYARPEIGGTRGGVQPTGPDGHWLEPMTTLSVIAGMTSRIRLGTNILIAALRRPVVLAKAAATLDVLSDGRLDLGVGVGWQREEYEAAALNFDERGQLLDQSLDLCQTFWREQRANYDSDGLSFKGIHMMPKPVQPGGVPFWVSGTVNPRVVRRLARFGSGWIPWGDDARDVATGIDRMREAVSSAGRDPSGLRIVGGLRAVRRPDRSVDIDQTMEAVPDLVAAGVTDLRCEFSLPKDAGAAEDFARAVVVAFRPAAGRCDLD